MRVLDTFLELVRIDSETFHEAAVVEYVAAAARDCGFEAYVDEAGKSIGGEAGNVYVNIPGAGVDAPPLIFASHLDTVSPGRGIMPAIRDGKVFSGGDTVLGADCKAGTAVIIELMRMAAGREIAHGPLEIIFTVAEERQMLGARNIELGRIRSRHAFVLDGAGEVGRVINAAPTQDNIEFVFKGREAHAGVEPEKGINAIYGASWAISLMKLGRIDSETTANLGVIEGGREVNIVPDRVSVLGEIRSFDLDKLREQRKSMLRAAMEAEVAVGVGVEAGVERAYDGYQIDESDPVIQLAVEAGRAMGTKIELTRSGGASDANYLNSAGIRSVVLCMGVIEPHTRQEYIRVRELDKLLRFCTELTAAAGRLRGTG